MIGKYKEIANANNFNKNYNEPRLEKREFKETQRNLCWSCNKTRHWSLTVLKEPKNTATNVKKKDFSIFLIIS